MNELDVHTGHQIFHPVGRLSATRGKHVFSYRHDAQEAVSLTMPIRNESYIFEQLHPVFQMNLPEGALRAAIERMTAKQYGSDDLSLLLMLGTHQIGRIAYSPPDEQPYWQQDSEWSLEQILGHEDADLFHSLLLRYARTSGVAGVQPKILLDLPPRLTLPVERYLIKSWGDDYPQLACNEFVCLAMARDAGLTVPEFHLSDNAKLLISKRFDVDASGHALGFEDFCVLQAKGTREKYDSTLEACTHTLRQFVSPAHLEQALYDFFKLTWLNIRLRNGDAHLKNIGVCYPQLSGYHQGTVSSSERRMAPVFDVVSTVPYLPRDTMALSLTGSKRWPKAKVVQSFGSSHCQLSRARIEQALAEVEAGIQQNLPLLDQLAGRHPDFAVIAERMQGLIAAAP